MGNSGTDRSNRRRGRRNSFGNRRIDRAIARQEPARTTARHRSNKAQQRPRKRPSHGPDRNARVDQAAGTSMTSDLEPTPMSGSNVWPTRPVTPARSVMAGGRVGRRRAVRRRPPPITTDLGQAGPRRPSTIAGRPGAAGISLTSSTATVRFRTGRSSTAHYSLIWLSLMLVARGGNDPQRDRPPLNRGSPRPHGPPERHAGH